ncbi:MAG: hypothetical protein ACPGR2_05215 [Psychrobium sp.]
MKLPNTIALLASLLLLPALSEFISTLTTMAGLTAFFQSASINGTADPKLISGFLASHIVSQILSIAILLPGLIFTFIAIIKFNYAAVWFRRVLTVYQWLLILSLPIVSFIGLLIWWLKIKMPQNSP